MSTPATYVPLRNSRSRFIAIGDLRCHVREWGPPEAPLLVLLHGARDTSASFQFVVDALSRSWRVVAPDWRGHGLSSWTAGHYWLSDFLGDLDAVLRDCAPGEAAPIAAHSMGGAIASVYAGIRPDRISHLVLLDSLGPSLNRLPVHVAPTLSDLLTSLAAERARRPYADIADMTDRLMRGNRRLSRARAGFIAEVNAQPLPGGGFGWPYDPGFTRIWPTLHSVAEWGECWRRIAAPVLCLTASDARVNGSTSDPEAVRERGRFFRNLTLRSVPETGHNLHHDAPAAVAEALEDFIRLPLG
ncbi:MAG TPA: alpha/beta hydrolase [Caulobacteraceae bacterium]|nr:alpha/beta hydrolase [Caulobacteraceae bacterium]